MREEGVKGAGKTEQKEEEAVDVWLMDLAALHFCCRRIALKDQDIRLLLKEEKKRIFFSAGHQ